MHEVNLKMCRICGSDAVGFLYEVDSLAAKDKRRFHICNTCETVLDEIGVPLSYDSDAAYNSPKRIQFYVEVGAGLHMLSTIISLLSKTCVVGVPAPRFLDVGAGFGYTVSIAAAQGWDAIGLEPSAMGAFGKQQLGVKLETCYLEDSGFEEESFDFISSSEVIEHVSSPSSFVETLSRYLKQDGVLALTTPNGVPIRMRDDGDKEWYEALSPGYHMNLLSPKALTMVLSRVGFTDIRHFLTGGSSQTKHIITLAAKRDGIIPREIDFDRTITEDTKEVYGRYLEGLIKWKIRAGEIDPVYEGALFRLFEHRLHAGNYPGATETCAAIDDLHAQKGLGIVPFAAVIADTLEEYLEKVPAYAGMFCFCRGMLLLNSTKLHLDAAQWFETAVHLFCVEQRIGVFPRVLWPERGELHVGIALLYAGKRKEAIAIFNKLLNREDIIGCELVESTLWNKGVAHLQLSEDSMAFSTFTDLFFRQLKGISLEARRSAQHAVLAIRRIMQRSQDSAKAEQRVLESIEARLETIEKTLCESKRSSNVESSQK